MDCKHFLLLLLANFIFCACQSRLIDDDEATEDGKVKVSFCVSSIEQIPFENTSTRTSFASLCSRFTLALFQDDTKVKVVSQTSDEASFGTVSMQLQPGVYQLVAIAHNGLGNCTVSSPSRITFKDNKATDTFFFADTLTVTESSAESLSLRRAVSMLRFVITDDMPENVAQMKFYYTGGSSTFNAATGFGCVNSKQTEIFNISSDAYGQPSTFEVYTFPHALTDSLTVKVTALDAEGGTLVENTYTDVPVRQNVITRHTGTFFTSVSGSTSFVGSFSIPGDGQWEATIDY